MSTPVRDVSLGRIEATFAQRSDGTMIVRSTAALPPYPEKITERLDHWAKVAPERTFIAQRGSDGSWRQLTYGEARDRARSIGQALIDRGLSVDRAVAILSGNDSDVVVAGHDRDDIRILIFPDLYACQDLCPEFARKVPPAELLAHPEVRNKFQLLIDDLAATSTGSSTRIAAAMLLHEAASLDKGEITDKGSLNQRAVLQHRNDLVEELYSAEMSSRVIVARPKK